MSFKLKQDREKAVRFADTVRIISYAVSLGQTRSLLFCAPTDTTLQSTFHLEGRDTESYRESAGEGVFRIFLSTWKMPKTSSLILSRRWARWVCHRQIHALFSEAELDSLYPNVEALLAEPAIQKFVAWVSKKPPGFCDGTKRSSRRR